VHPEAVQLIQTADTMWEKKTPWDSMYKLELLGRKANQASQSTAECKDKLLWMIQMVNDRFRAGMLQVGEASHRNLGGKGLPGNKGLLDLGLTKKDIKDRLLGQVLEGLPFAADSKATIRMLLMSYDAYREKFGYPNEPSSTVGGANKRAVIGLLEVAARDFFKFAEQAIYLQDHDSCIKLGLKQGSSAAEILQSGTCAQILEGIVNAARNAAEASQPGGQNRGMQSSPTDDAEDKLPEFHIALAFNPSMKQADPKLMMQINKLTDEGKEQLKAFETGITVQVDEGIEFISEDKLETAKAVCDAIKNTSFGKIVGVPCDLGGYVIILYNQKVAARVQK